jgi:hypothetical protein
MEMKILLLKKTIFVAFAERPEEAPANAYKKVFLAKDCNVQLD